MSNKFDSKLLASDGLESLLRVSMESKSPRNLFLESGISLKSWRVSPKSFHSKVSTKPFILTVVIAMFALFGFSVAANNQNDPNNAPNIVVTVSKCALSDVSS